MVDEEADLSFTYRELDQRTNRLANRLVELGVEYGSHVGIVSFLVDQST